MAYTFCYKMELLFRADLFDVSDGLIAILASAECSNVGGLILSDSTDFQDYLIGFRHFDMDQIDIIS